LQYLSGAPLPPDGLLKEKNWNPFIYKGRLLFSQVSGVGDRGGGGGAIYLWGSGGRRREETSVRACVRAVVQMAVRAAPPGCRRRAHCHPHTPTTPTANHHTRRHVAAIRPARRHPAAAKRHVRQAV
jgi:hypothetical protein